MEKGKVVSFHGYYYHNNYNKVGVWIATFTLMYTMFLSSSKLAGFLSDRAKAMRVDSKAVAIVS